MSSVDDNMDLAVLGGLGYGLSFLASWIHTYAAAENWRDPANVYEPDKNARGYRRPTLVVPVFSFSF